MIVLDTSIKELEIPYMSTDEEVEGGDGVDVGDYLAELMRMLLRVSSGPLTVRRVPGSWHEVAAVGSAPVAKFTRQADAALFVRVVGDLRAETAALVEVLTQHRDDGSGSCGQDGQPVPCTTRRLVLAQLKPRAVALETVAPARAVSS